MPDQAIFEAILAGDADAVEGLLAAESALASARNEQGVSALMAAWYTFNPRLRALLREHAVGLDVFEAATVGDVEHLAALLDRDDSLIRAYSADGFTALHFAGFFNQPEAARVLIGRNAPLDAVTRNPLANMPLHAAAAGRANDVCRMLLDAGADANATQHGGFTPLHEAAHHGNTELVELLLAHGADPTLTNEDGKSAADLAASEGHTALAARLRSAG